MLRALVLFSCIASMACLDPVRQPPTAGDPGPGDDDGSGKFDRPAASDEICGDGQDNDGDGEVDEGCPCTPGDEIDCYLAAPETREVGACSSGIQVCTGDESTEFGSWGRCEGAQGPAVERCNGVDDDCDGQVDEDRVCGDDAECHYDTDCAAGQACVEGVCVGSGELRFSLVWDHPGDVDLHVRTPLGNEIYYGSLSADGGTLDHDDTSGTGPENIFWGGAPPAGTYLVCVVPFRVDAAVSWTLTIDDGGRAHDENGISQPTSDAWSVHCDEASEYLVTSIDIR